MFCQNCGKEVSQGDKFCQNCGAPLSTVNQHTQKPAWVQQYQGQQQQQQQQPAGVQQQWQQPKGNTNATALQKGLRYLFMLFPIVPTLFVILAIISLNTYDVKEEIANWGDNKVYVSYCVTGRGDIGGLGYFSFYEGEVFAPYQDDYYKAYTQENVDNFKSSIIREYEHRTTMYIFIFSAMAFVGLGIMKLAHRFIDKSIAKKQA